MGLKKNLEILWALTFAAIITIFIISPILPAITALLQFLGTIILIYLLYMGLKWASEKYLG